MENKMQDSAVMDSFQSTDLQTLQCESRKRMTSEYEGALNRTGCPQSWLASSLLLLYVLYLTAEFDLDSQVDSGTGCCPRETLTKCSMPGCLPVQLSV